MPEVDLSVTRLHFLLKSVLNQAKIFQVALFPCHFHTHQYKISWDFSFLLGF